VKIWSCVKVSTRVVRHGSPLGASALAAAVHAGTDGAEGAVVCALTIAGPHKASATGKIHRFTLLIIM
jgi:hypothetical protein